MLKMVSPKTAGFLLLLGATVLCFHQAGADRVAMCGDLLSASLADAEQKLIRIDDSVDGRLGACVGVHGQIACNRGQERFAMQSVMKLLVAVAVLRQVDLGKLALDEKITLTRRDVSVGIQPLANVLETQHEVTLDVRDLTKRMLIESDSTATDVLIRRLGGTRAVQQILDHLALRGMRIDRTERELQTEPFDLPSSLPWRGMDDYEKKIKGINPHPFRGEAGTIEDERDTATPEGLAMMLLQIADGNILSSVSTQELIHILAECRTFPNRLKAGAPEGWVVAHKTGTSRTFNGITDVTNDVGYLITPNGDKVIAVALLAKSAAHESTRAASLASVGTIAADFYRDWSLAKFSTCKESKMPPAAPAAVERR